MNVVGWEAINKLRTESEWWLLNKKKHYTDTWTYIQVYSKGFNKIFHMNTHPNTNKRRYTIMLKT